MIHTSSKLNFLAALAASASLVAAPAAAAPLQLPQASAYAGLPANPGADAGRERAADHRWYGRGYRHGGIDAGDVLAGVLIIGGIAAIASAASKNNRDRDYRDRDYRDRDYRDRDYRDRPYDYRDRPYEGDRPYDYRGSDSRDSRYGAGQGIDRAVDMCVREVERREQVESVESVQRNADGWYVMGELRNGRNFNCQIGADGRIEDIDLGGVASNDGQWDDDQYARAREAQERDYDGGS